MKSRLSIALIALATAASTQAATIVFSEDFGSLADATTITTSNTDLTYVRVGTGGGSIVALNPSTVGSGSSAFITGPTNTSLNGIGVGSGLDFGTNNTITLAFDFKLTDTSGDVVWGIGTGTSFTGNGTFSTAQGLGWFQADGTNLQRRQGGSWTTMSTLAANTSYSFLATFDLGANTMSVSLNNSLIAEDVAVTTADVDPDGFRIYAVSGSDVEVDNIVLTSIPEPTAALLGSLGLLGLLRRRR